MNLPSTIVIATVVACGIVRSHNVANGATLADWQKVSGKTGCDSIPDSSLQQTCNNRQKDVEDNCKEDKFSCDKLDPSGLQKNIDNVQAKITQVEKGQAERSKLADGLKSKLPSITDENQRRDTEQSIKSAETDNEKAKNDIYEYNKKISEWKSTLGKESQKIDDALYYGKRCVTARVEMQKVFGQAISTAQQESDPAIVIEAKKHLPNWEAGQKSHGIALGDTQTAVEKCIRMR